jgi:hypothetical protein
MHFLPTHSVTYPSGAKTKLMLLQTPGRAYWTRSLWRLDAVESAFELNENGQWLFHGKPFTGHIETCTPPTPNEEIERAMETGDGDTILSAFERGATLDPARVLEKILRLESMAKRTEIVRLMLARGAVLSNEQAQSTILSGWNVQILRWFLEAGGSANARGTDGISLLHLACWKNRVKMAALLIEFGADLTLRDRKGRTPLDVAIAHNRPKCVGVLMRHGAVSIPDQIFRVMPLN